MTKADLVDKVSKNSSLTKRDAEIIVQAVLDSIIESLQSGEKVELRGFGGFRLRERASRQGRNPKTGEKVHVPAKKVPYFKLGKELKEFINS
jgi:integration host factor subunit beta